MKSLKILTRSVIVLEPEKDYLLKSRLELIAKKIGLKTIEELAQKLCTTGSGLLHEKVVEAMTTNETSFFRDVHPFDAFRDSISRYDSKTKAKPESFYLVWVKLKRTRTLYHPHGRSRTFPRVSHMGYQLPGH